MKISQSEIAGLRSFFESSLEIETKVYGLRLIEIVLLLNEENQFLKNRLIKAEEDMDFMERKADDWMLKFMELSEIRRN